MRTKALALLLVTVALGCHAAASGSPVVLPTRPTERSPRIVPKPRFEERKLANGLRILVLPQPHEQAVAAVLVIPSRGKDTDGLRAFSESAFSAGTFIEGAGAPVLEPTVDGGPVYVSVLPEGTSFSMAALPESREGLFKMLSSFALRPAFDDAELEVFRRRASTNVSWGNPNLFDAIETHGTRGLRELYAHIDRKRLVEFHKNWIVPDGAALVVVGPINNDEVTRLAERFFGDWSGKVAEVSASEKETDSPSEATSRPRIRLAPTPMIAPKVEIWVDGPPHGTREELAFSLLAEILDRRIWEALRVNYPAAYGPSAGLYSEERRVGLYLQAKVRGEDAVGVVREVGLVLGRVQTRISDAERIAGVNRLRLRDRVNQAGPATLAVAKAYRHLRGESEDESADELENISERELIEVGMKYIVPKNIRIELFGKVEHLAAELREIGEVMIDE